MRICKQCGGTEFYSTGNKICKACAKKAVKKCQQKKKEIIKKYSKEYYEKNKEQFKKRSDKYREDKPLYMMEYHIKRRYGLSKQKLEEIKNNQKGACLGCGINLEGIKQCIDHCHKSNVVRGILCQTCNTALGMVKDSPQVLRNLANYLENNISLKIYY